MSSEQELSQLEALSKQFYDASNSEERATAEKALVNFVLAPDCLPTCRLLLERGNSSYAQLLAATTLTKLVSKNPHQLTLQQRIEIKNYVLTYLARFPKLAAFVIQALVQLFARLVKIGWFDSENDEFVFRGLINQLRGFIQGNVEYCAIGVQLLSQVTSEINQETDGEARFFTKQRKTAVSFRDAELYDIFQLSCDLLRKAHESWKSLPFEDKDEHTLMNRLLKLTYSCLSFDFIGVSNDDSTDDLSTMQIPTSWKPTFLDFNTLKLFFDLYHCLTPSLSSVVLLCIVQVASVRRTLFNNEERDQYLAHLLRGVKSILESPQKLSDTNNYHEFCRLLARLKSNFQLGELVRAPSYPDTIRLIAKFTVTSLQMWQFAPNSIHYLLSFWQRMMASVPYVKATEPHFLETYTPEVTRTFITSRLESVATVVRDFLDDPFDDSSLIQQQLEHLSTIGRCEYEKTCVLLVQLFDQSAQRYQELISVPNVSPIDLKIQEGQLTWLVYIIASVIGGRVSCTTGDEYDAMDGELICRVLQLVNLSDTRISQGCSEKLELSMIYFFQQFKKIYIGDQIQRTSKVYKRLSEVLGVSDEFMILSVFVRKILTNLKYRCGSEEIINKTLHLLNDLSVGYTCLRKLVKLEEVQFMLNNHTSEHFPFLGTEMQLSDTRCRTVFYTALGRLSLINVVEDEDKFEHFMMPLTMAFQLVRNSLAAGENGVFEEEKTKRLIIGLARDLRGLAYAFNSKVSFMILFDWINPAYLPIMHRAVELWYHDPSLTTPVLKLLAELALNRTQRLQFDVSSPNGIILFHQASKMLVSYGSRLLTMNNIPKDQMYRMKLKGIAVCFTMLKFALCGGYVNFGVCRFYGDTSLDDALNVFMKLLMSVSQSDILQYPKLCQVYYSLLECLAEIHLDFLSNLDTQPFLYILSSILEGLSSPDTMVSASCCTTLDNIVSFVFKNVSRTGRRHASGNGSNDEATCLRVMKQHPELLQQMLSTCLNIVIFEECRNQWSMSRPLLGLILLNEEYFNQLRQSIINNQLPEKQCIMALWFENLMEGIERNLQTKNREKFTQNLSIFRREVNESLNGPNIINSSLCDVN